MNLTKWSDLKHKATPEQVAKDRVAAEAVVATLGLGLVRKARKHTQVELAKALDIPQSSISEVENRHDIMLSTLLRYVDALGGKLEVRAIFKDASFSLNPPEATSSKVQSITSKSRVAKKGPSFAVAARTPKRVAAKRA